MKKLMIFLMILITAFSYAKSDGKGSGGNSGNGGNSETVKETVKEKNENENTRDDIAKYNWGQIKEDSYESKEARELDKATIKHYGNLMKITERYNISIRNQEEYEYFHSLYINGTLQVDEGTWLKIKLEFERYLAEEKEDEDTGVENGD